MGVVFEGEAIVSDIVGGILGLHHGAQGNGLNEILFLLALTTVHQRVERTRDSALGARGFHLIAELHDKLAQSLQLCGVWLVVDTVRQCLGFSAFLHLTNALCHVFVGQQHKFLNELGGIVRLLEVGPCGLALFVDIEVQLLAVELDATSLETAFAQLLGQLVEYAQVFSILGRLLATRTVFSGLS